MFKGYAGLALEKDHLDLSYRTKASWTVLTPSGSLNTLSFDIGDPDSGPNVALGMIMPVEGEVLDWKHSIDPVHHHGSDQFRVVSKGEWIVAGKKMGEASISFQESGYIYQEHPVEGQIVWHLLLMGDRRGARATLRRQEDLLTIFDAGEYYGTPVDGETIYPHPSGDRGVAAVATSMGPCDRGYLLRPIADLGSGDTSGVVTGLLGDLETGPIVHAFKVGAGETATPALVSATELVIVVVSGSAEIDGSTYQAGDLRVQSANADLGPITAGPAGLEMVLIVGDRRSRVEFRGSGSAPEWIGEVATLQGKIVPTPGGPRPRRSRSLIDA